MLLTWIAEVADEPLVLERADRRVEWVTNTWSLSAEAEDRRSLSVSAVLTAFERTASAIRVRIRELGFPGVATFYVWHDEQAGQLRCSTGSVPADALPFGDAYVLSDDLGPVIEGFLVGGEPGVTAWSGLEGVPNASEQAVAGPDLVPLRVWATSVGAAAH
ncbi:hypothetical protein EAO70_08785 [Streptomyces sp. adm13(2018)]|uniref:hypothetical protein n=1 Tax=Streptomyces sp. adm13(2018) TaxID=2479007 RepID=UPI0011CE2548|nr:hypothetical protein [Streptomyces sp. adm13(2018)]TXS20458.1 hypothetical protein EAO70_08785 [Streptomyces sp. adm13(2018)]